MEEKFKKAVTHYIENMEFHDPKDVKHIQQVLFNEFHVIAPNSDIIHFWRWHSGNVAASWLKVTSNEEIKKTFLEFIQLPNNPDETSNYKYPDNFNFTGEE